MFDCLLKSLFIFALCCFAWSCARTLPENAKPNESSVSWYDKSLAIVVGIDAYRSGTERLNKSVASAKLVADELKRRGFEVIELYDRQATSSVLQKTLMATFERMNSNDRLLFYFAGHSRSDFESEAGKEVGYLLPADGNEDDYSGHVSLWNLRKFLKTKCRAKHALLVFDACFEGRLIDKDALGEDKNVSEMLSDSGVYGLMAGDLDRLEVDGVFSSVQGIFTRSFIQGLSSGAADSNRDGYISTSELGRFVYNDVHTRNNSLHPDYGLMHGGGQFLFKRNDKQKTDKAKADPLLAEMQDDYQQAFSYCLGNNPSEKKAEKWLEFSRKWKKFPEKSKDAEHRAAKWKFLDKNIKQMSADWNNSSDKQKLEQLERLLEKAPQSWHQLPRLKNLKKRLEEKLSKSDYGSSRENYEVETSDVFPAEMVAIKAGKFMMGSPEDEEGRDPDETLHEVSIEHDYLIGKYEVTQAQWVALMGSNPSTFPGCGPDCPVEYVSWYEAVDFCNRLSKLEGFDSCYTINGEDVQWKRDCKGYRLPTEAEWEYATRAGTTTALHTGKLTPRGKADGPELDELGWYDGNSGIEYEGTVDCSHWVEVQHRYKRCGTHPVGGKKPNPWGIYDMSGNVWEWVWDVYPNELVKFKERLKDAPFRMNRGGGWNAGPLPTRSAARYYASPKIHANNVGLRLARML